MPVAWRLSMCGIAGLVTRQPFPDVDRLGRALHLLAPRGPDGLGRARARLGRHDVELGVRRLALVDVPGGAQPVERPSGARLVFNGEVYNHDALRTRLEARGERFASRGDAEVLAALLDVEGVAGLAHVEGSYAFAFLKGPDGPLWLGRDPHGVRPLVVRPGPDELCFASTLDGLRAMSTRPPAPDLEALADVLRDGVVSGTRTALQGVLRVPPGAVLEVDAQLGWLARRVPAPLEPAESADALEAAPADVLEALRLAVHDRLALERPAAVLLSGGIDSALLAALAAERARLPAYTLAFPGHGGFDESARAARTAEKLGLEHVVVPCPHDPTAWVLGAAAAFDEPFADASAVPTWGLARAVGGRARVALSGTGGDEVFGGYRRYWLLGAGPWLRHVPALVREPVRRVLARALPQGGRLLGAASDPEGFYRGLMRLQPDVEMRALLGPAFGALARTAPQGAPLAGPRRAREAMADDLVRYLPDDLLVKEDRAFMAFGVEGRHPFLDARVSAAARRLELRGSAARARQKQVLRAYVREVVDPDLARGTKRGFAFPVDALYRGPLRPLAEDALLGARARGRGLVAPEVARTLLGEHVTGVRQAGAVLHACVMLELWCRRVLDAAAPARA